MKITAVIPAYNVQGTVKKVVDGIKNLVDEVIVINDASGDETYDILKELGVVVVNHRRNTGLGGALRDGFKEALKRGADVVVTLDSDGQHDPNDVERLLNRLEANKVDVIIGSRLLERARWNRFPRHRLYGNRILTFITNRAVGRQVTTDSQSGYRVLKRAVLERTDLKGMRMEIASEIIFEAARGGFAFDEVPIEPTYDREHSNVRLIKDTFRILNLLTRKRLTTKRRANVREDISRA